MKTISYKKIDEIIEHYKKDEYLIQILKDIQNINGFLSKDIQRYVSKKMNIPLSKVNSVVTFYSLFTMKPKGKYIISVCMGTACYVKGSNDILKKLKEILSIDEDSTTSDSLFTLKVTRCIGACGLAPVITINDDVYGRLKLEEIDKILNEYRKKEKNH
jgi:NADH:ubiquinone oxidoreductase subunit E